MTEKVISPWQSAAFLAMAVLFSVWQPAGRMVGAAVMLCFGLYGFFLWVRQRGRQKKRNQI